MPGIGERAMSLFYRAAAFSRILLPMWGDGCPCRGSAM